MKQISKEEDYSNHELLSQWINEGRFVTIFEAKRKNGFDYDTHYVKVCLISNDKGTWDMTDCVARMLGVRYSEVYGKNGTLIWHGSIFDLMKNIIYKLRRAGYNIDVDTKDDSAVNCTFRWV